MNSSSITRSQLSNDQESNYDINSYKKSCRMKVDLFLKSQNSDLYNTYPPFLKEMCNSMNDHNFDNVKEFEEYLNHSLSFHSKQYSRNFIYGDLSHDLVFILDNINSDDHKLIVMDNVLKIKTKFEEFYSQGINKSLILEMAFFVDNTSNFIWLQYLRDICKTQRYIFRISLFMSVYDDEEIDFKSNKFILEIKNMIRMSHVCKIDIKIRKSHKSSNRETDRYNSYVDKSLDEICLNNLKAFNPIFKFMPLDNAEQQNARIIALISECSKTTFDNSY